MGEDTDVAEEGEVGGCGEVGFGEVKVAGGEAGEEGSEHFLGEDRGAFCAIGGDEVLIYLRDVFRVAGQTTIWNSLNSQCS